MKIILNKQDVLNILSWAGISRSIAEDVRVKWDESEQKTLIKIRELIR